MAERQVLALTCPCGASLHADTPSWLPSLRTIYDDWARDHREHTAPPPDPEPDEPPHPFSFMAWNSNAEGDEAEALRVAIWDAVMAYAIALTYPDSTDVEYKALRRVLADERLGLAPVVQANMLTLVLIAAGHAREATRRQGV